MRNTIIFTCLFTPGLMYCSQSLHKEPIQQVEQTDTNYKKLTSEEEAVIVHKQTERAFKGKYFNYFEAGTYVCKRCGTLLYRSADKFQSSCGWPSFDDEIEGAVKRVPDADGERTEILCAHCGAHLGHIFMGEGFTAKNTRHCVNSISLEFVPAAPKNIAVSDTGIFAGGCFWGVEFYMKKISGVISTEVGYIGGHTSNPDYEAVSSHTTGYAEAVQIVFDPSKTTFESIAKTFFEIHDPTQLDYQGPDMGDQYRSEIFYRKPDQKATAEKLIGILKQKGYNIVTKLEPASKFYKAEPYHQDYYNKNGHTPYCHKYTKRF